MRECNRSKILLKGIMIVFKTKGPQIRCIPHGRFELSQCKSKKHAGLQNLKTWINSKKGPQIRWGLAQCKSICEEHAGSDISFENITLCLDQLPLKLQFTTEKRTLETPVLSRETNTLPQYKSSCKEQANCPLKLEIVLRLAYHLGPLEQTTNSCTLNHPISDHEL